MKVIREQLNTLQLNKNTYSHAKIKQELNEYETNKMKKNLEKENMNKKMHEHNIKQLKLLEEEMKITCDQLEELEKQAVDRLRRTKYMNLRLFSGDKTRNNFSAKKRIKNKNNKNINRSMENIKLNGFDNDQNKSLVKDEDNYYNKSMIVNKNTSMSPHFIKKDIKIKKINKIHKGLSIGSFPKTNKESNSQKINLNLKNSSFEKRNVKENKNYKLNSVKSSKSIDKK